MTNFRCGVNGLFGNSLPWSFAFTFSGSLAEAAVYSAWSAAVSTFLNPAASTPGYLSLCNADVTSTSAYATTLNATMHQTTKTSGAVVYTGTDTHDSLPWSTAMVVKTTTPYSTRWGHGRIFLPAFANDRVVAHVITSATATAVKGLVNTMMTSMTGSGLTPFIYNKKTRKDGTAPYTVTNVTGWDVSNKPASQRRRVSKIVPTYT